MRAVSKRNFSSAKYEKFICPQAKRSSQKYFSLNLLLSKLLLSSQKRKRDVVRIPAAIETPLVPAENAPSSSGWHSNVVLLLDLMMSFLCTVFSCAFPSYTLKFDFSFSFFNFVWMLIIFLDPYNYYSLLSSQSIRRRRSS
jgi:hypothetical protein